MRKDEAEGDEWGSFPLRSTGSAERVKPLTTSLDPRTEGRSEGRPIGYVAYAVMAPGSQHHRHSQIASYVP